MIFAVALQMGCPLGDWTLARPGLYFSPPKCLLIVAVNIQPFAVTHIFWSTPSKVTETPTEAY